MSFFEVLGHFSLIVDLIIRLAKIKGIVQRGGCEFHPHLIGDMIEGHQVLAVHILNRHSESDVRMPHFHQRLERRIAPVETVRDSRILSLVPAGLRS